MHLSQRCYITELLSKTNMLFSTTKATPIATDQKLDTDDSPIYDDPKTYRKIIGALQYICHTRPDLCYAVNRLSQFMQSPKLIHWEAVKRVLRYLNGTKTHGLLITPAEELTIKAFADANWGPRSGDRRSTSGTCTLLHKNPITWGSRKQPVVARSTTEAEYRSVADAVADTLWFLTLMKEMHIDLIELPSIWCDNTGTVALTANPVLHSKSKHFELDLYFIREKAAEGIIRIGYVPASEQVADILTKPLPEKLFVKFRDKLQVISAEYFHSLSAEGAESNKAKDAGEIL